MRKRKKWLRQVPRFASYWVRPCWWYSNFVQHLSTSFNIICHHSTGWAKVFNMLNSIFTSTMESAADDGTSITIGNRYDIKVSYDLTPSWMQSSHDLLVFWLHLSSESKQKQVELFLSYRKRKCSCSRACSHCRPEENQTSQARAF